jgi:hypothetical protein
MRTVLLWTIAVLGAGCGPSPSERLDGWWESTNADGTIGVFLGFDSGKGTYAAQRIVLNYNSSQLGIGDDQVEIGVYTATDGAIAFTPEQSTCPGPIPSTGQIYGLSGDTLRIPNWSWAQSLSNSFGPPNLALSLGCYGSIGGFTSLALAPVSN